MTSQRHCLKKFDENEMSGQHGKAVWGYPNVAGKNSCTGARVYRYRQIMHAAHVYTPGQCWVEKTLDPRLFVLLA
jgi:hypothetical protein